MAKYSALHIRVRKARGTPSHCSVCGLNDPLVAYDWANLTGNYEDINDYSRMCRRCHREYDQGRNKNLYRSRADSRRSEIVSKYLNGDKFTDLCYIYGIGATTLARWVRGLKQPTTKVDIRRSLDAGAEMDLCNKYLKGKTSTTLAVEFGISSATVIETLIRHNIKRRSRGTRDKV